MLTSYHREFSHLSCQLHHTMTLLKSYKVLCHLLIYGLMRLSAFQSHKSNNSFFTGTPRSSSSSPPPLAPPEFDIFPVLSESVNQGVHQSGILRRCLQDCQHTTVAPSSLHNPIRYSRNPQDTVRDRIQIQQHHPPHILIDTGRLSDPDPRRGNGRPNRLYWSNSIPIFRDGRAFLLGDLRS